MTKLLVTGATGFVGTWLGKRVPFIASSFDVIDKTAIAAQLQKAHPTHVIHLAGQAHVARSIQNPQGTYDVNVLGTRNLLEALQETGFTGRLLCVSSADVYGVAQSLPMDEEHPLRPRNPYAESKVEAEKFCLQSGLDVVIARPFNHIGPGQSKDFALPAFVEQLRRGAVVEVGNLEATRDFTDVRDIVEGYLLLLEKGRSGFVYNLCSGQERSMRQVLEALIALSGKRVTVRLDQARLRPLDQPRMVGCCRRMQQQTGWRPTIGFEESLRNLWERT